MKYILYIDYRATSWSAPRGIGYDYIPMKAKNFKEAIEEADSIYNSETMYLIRIMEKIGKVGNMDGAKYQDYKAVECKRSAECGWHANDAEHGEDYNHVIRRCYMKNHEWFEGIVVE